MKLILASNNKAKLREFRRMFEGTEVELVSQREAGFDIEVEENGTSFEENSYIKAKTITDLSGCAAIADDSGIEVDCLGGEPGIYSARYGVGHEASDEERNNYMLAKMGDSQDRTARYVCAVCCTMPNGDVIRTRGECEGDILFSPRVRPATRWQRRVRQSRFRESERSLCSTSAMRKSRKSCS